MKLKASALAVAAIAGLAVLAVRNADASIVSYSGGTYTQDFNSLPNPGATSVNTANPVTIPATTGTEYTFTNAANGIFDFAAAIDSSGTIAGSTGGLGLSTTMSGWSGGAATAIKFGATNGDQTTGGDLSFGPASSTNRALGLISTSSSGATYFGVAISNQTGASISAINLAFTWEFWKQGTLAKSVALGYTVDNSNSLNLISATTNAGFTALGSSPTETTGTVGAVDGTLSANQSPFSDSNLSLATAVAPGGTLWLTWEMANAGSSGQGFGIDGLSFSSSVPEPASLGLIALGTLMAARRRQI